MKSVDDLGHRYEQMVPDYPVKEAIMRNVVCMFDSGYTLPQGREVINYYYPLQHGLDGLIESVGCDRAVYDRDAGFEGMRTGGKRRLFIPYQLAYGVKGRGTIPPMAELIFDATDEKKKAGGGTGTAAWPRPEVTARQCEKILARFVSRDSFRVVLLHG
jgi:hypothetical protein